MKRIPWGVFSGVCAIIVFYVTVAFVGLNVIFGGIAAQTNSEFGMFENWWQLVLFISDLVFAVGLLLSLVMFVFVKVRYKTDKTAAYGRG